MSILTKRSSLLYLLLNILLGSKANHSTTSANLQAMHSSRPSIDNYRAWSTYWEKQGYPWRTEPEIDKERQEYLAWRRSTLPDIECGSYPFKDVKLKRADVE